MPRRSSKMPRTCSNPTTTWRRRPSQTLARADGLTPVDQANGQVRLHLPEGFQYRSFHDTESTVTLDDGTTLPGRHDGMAAFPGAERERAARPQPRDQQAGDATFGTGDAVRRDGAAAARRRSR